MRAAFRGEYGAQDAFIEAALSTGKYMVTPDGVVWNLDYRGTGRPRLCKLGDLDGYRVVQLSDGARESSVLVHRVVLIRYLGRCQGRIVANHKDGVKSNNHIDNLEWVTQGVNVHHAWRSGLRRRFTDPHGGQFKSVLSDDDIRAIHKARADGETYGQIAGRYSLTSSAIYAICKGKVARRIFEELHP